MPINETYVENAFIQASYKVYYNIKTKISTLNLSYSNLGVTIFSKTLIKNI